VRIFKKYQYFNTYFLFSICLSTPFKTSLINTTINNNIQTHINAPIHICICRSCVLTGRDAEAFHHDLIDATSVLTGKSKNKLTMMNNNNDKGDGLHWSSQQTLVMQRMWKLSRRELKSANARVCGCVCVCDYFS
jgi:hypothetical protein